MDLIYILFIDLYYRVLRYILYLYLYLSVYIYIYIYIFIIENLRTCTLDTNIQNKTKPGKVGLENHSYEAQDLQMITKSKDY